MKDVSFKFIVTIVAFVLLVIFAVQNSESATIKFLVWHFETFQAIIIIVSAALGALIGFTIFMIKYFKQGKSTKADQKALNEATNKSATLEAEIESLKKKLEEAVVVTADASAEPIAEEII